MKKGELQKNRGNQGMLRQESRHRLIGQILIDAGFISLDDLEAALTQQRQTRESIGIILVSQSHLDLMELKVALLLQEQLTSAEHMIALAAGARETLGQLLVHAKRLTSEQLDFALLKQEREGGRLGDILINLGWISASELGAVATFQKSQGNNTQGLLQLGHLLMVTEDIHADELGQAVLQRASSRKKIGEILIEAGFVEGRKIFRALELQYRFTSAVLAALLAFTKNSLRGI